MARSVRDIHLERGCNHIPQKLPIGLDQPSKGKRLPYINNPEYIMKQKRYSLLTPFKFSQSDRNDEVHVLKESERALFLLRSKPLVE